MADYGSQLVKEQFLAEAKFKNPNEPGKRVQVGALTMVADLNRSTINEDFNKEKRREIELHWPEVNCDQEVVNATADCNITAAEPEADSKIYTLTRARMAEPFKVNSRKFETSMHTRETMVAESRYQQEKFLLQDLNQRVHTILNTPASKTDISDAGFGVLSDNVDPVTKDVLIHPSQWTTSGVTPVFYEIASRLGMKQPTLLSGGALHRMRYDVWKDKQPGDVARWEDFETYLDWSMDATLGAEKVFLVDAGVMAILNRPDFLNRTPEDVGADREVWSARMFMNDAKESEFAIGTGMKSGKGIGLYVDIDHQRTCVNRTSFFDSWRYVLNADVVLAPQTECSANAIGGKPYTGIVGITCGVIA